MRYFAGRTRWPDTYKKSMKGESGIFPYHEMAELPWILFGHERGNLTSTRVALINTPEARRVGEKSSEKKISSQIVRNNPGVCF